jgi:hypothetical protein
LAEVDQAYKDLQTRYDKWNKNTLTNW